MVRKNFICSEFPDIKVVEKSSGEKKKKDKFQANEISPSAANNSFDLGKQSSQQS